MTPCDRAPDARAPGTASLLAAAGVAAVGFVAIGVHVAERGAGIVDEPVARSIRGLDAPLADAVMAAITHAGGRPFLTVVVVVTAVIAARRRYWRGAWVVIGNALVIGALSMILKELYARERPAFAPVIPLPESYSFPSGHAIGALGVYGAVAAVIVALAPRARGAAIAVVVPLVLAIGASRVYLGVHWPLDVLAGYLAAVPPLAATVLLLRARPPPPAPAAAMRP